jgi:hypothetical protein
MPRRSLGLCITIFRVTLLQCLAPCFSGTLLPLSLANGWVHVSCDRRQVCLFACLIVYMYFLVYLSPDNTCARLCPALQYGTPQHWFSLNAQPFRFLLHAQLGLLNNVLVLRVFAHLPFCVIRTLLLLHLLHITPLIISYPPTRPPSSPDDKRALAGGRGEKGRGSASPTLLGCDKTLEGGLAFAAVRKYSVQIARRMHISTSHEAHSHLAHSSSHWRAHVPTRSAVFGLTLCAGSVHWCRRPAHSTPRLLSSCRASTITWRSLWHACSV